MPSNCGNNSASHKHTIIHKKLPGGRIILNYEDKERYASLTRETIIDIKRQEQLIKQKITQNQPLSEADRNLLNKLSDYDTTYSVQYLPDTGGLKLIKPYSKYEIEHPELDTLERILGSLKGMLSPNGLAQLNTAKFNSLKTPAEIISLLRYVTNEIYQIRINPKKATY